MSHEAVKWAMFDAPMPRTEKGKPDTTARHILAVIAQHVRDGGAEAWPAVARIQHATGYDRRTVQRALRRLVDAKLISDTGNGRSSTRYTLALDLIRPASDWEEIQAEELRQKAATAERVRRHRARVTDAECVTETSSVSVTGSDVTHAESVRNALESRYIADVTHSASVCNARNAARTVSEPSEEEPSSEPSAPRGAGDDGIPGQTCLIEAAAAAAPTGPTFDDFWQAYPRRKDKADARRAWDKALKGGVDPEHILRSATSYASARAGKDPQYTKLPATWLNKGSYDDEDDTSRSGVGSHISEWMHQ